MKLLKIALTGGPCSGKTTAMCRIKNAFTMLGYKVIPVTETATELFLSGINPETVGSRYSYQSKQCMMQLAKEDVAGKDAVYSGKDKVLIVCDRGIPDNAAYLTPVEYINLLREYHSSKTNALLRYDAVFMLNTVAKQSSFLYNRNLKGNPVRTENSKLSCELDDKAFFAWREHPNFYLIEAEDDFEKKMDILIHRVAEFAGEEPFEYTDSYVIEMPEIGEKKDLIVQKLEKYKLGPATDAVIVTEGDEKKYKIVCGRSEEYITKPHFLYYINKDQNRQSKLNSTLYCYPEGDYYFRIEKFDHEDKNAILTVDKRTKEEPILPDYIHILNKIK